MTVENLVRIVWSFCENQKKVEKWLFLAIFGLILAMFLTSLQYKFDEITHKGP